MTRRTPPLLSWVLLFFFSWHSRPAAALPSRLDFLGEARLPHALDVDGTPVGGLSGLVYDAERGLFLAQSDDQSERAPARFYALRVDLSGGTLATDGVTVTGVTTELAPNGQPYPPHSLDPEGIALAAGGRLFLSSEGRAKDGVPPFIRELALDGSVVASFELPAWFAPAADGTGGVRPNLGFESLTVSADGRSLYAGIENALVQDGLAAGLDTPSPVRLQRWDLASRRLVAEHLYWTDPLFAAATTPDGIAVNGLVDLLAVDDSHLLALERAFALGVGYRIRLFLVDLAKADDTAALPSLAPRRSTILAVRKQLLFDLGELGIQLDNLEGMSWGPRLADGRRSLLVVSDDNFNPEEITQVLAFGVSEEAVTIPEIQGAGHGSPLAGSWVFGVEGVVTAVAPKGAGFWFQDPVGDGDPATSDGLFVTGALPDPLRPGWVAQVSGRVEEAAGRAGELTLTRINASTVTLAGMAARLPAAVVIGKGGVVPPTGHVDDDGLRRYEPMDDALDFFESLEGMRVALDEARVVGPSDERGGLVVIPGGTGQATVQTVRGGLLESDEKPAPHRLLIDSTLLGSPARRWAVGQRVAGGFEGMLDYRYGAYRLLATRFPAAPSPVPEAETTELLPREGSLTVATFNVENLGGDASDDKLAQVARVIVENLASPQLLGLQEVQDDSGPADDGVSSADRTLERLLAAIVAAGGPAYQASQIDPLDKSVGGQPGGNIRPVWLYDPRTVRLVTRGTPDATTAARLEATAEGPRLAVSPALLAPLDPCFAGDPALAYEASRRPLAVELEIAGQRWFAVDNHLSSKGSDDRRLGSRQPPERHSEAQRTCQAERVAAWAREVLAADPGARLIVLGDLNELPGRPPLAALTAAGLVDLATALPAADRYSHVFEGGAALLDHILVSPALAAGAEIDSVHADADFPAGWRASDHDPLVARLPLAP